MLNAKTYKFLCYDEASRHLAESLGIENRGELEIISLLYMFNKDFLHTLFSLQSNYMGNCKQTT